MQGAMYYLTDTETVPLYTDILHWQQCLLSPAHILASSNSRKGASGEIQEFILTSKLLCANSCAQRETAPHPTENEWLHSEVSAHSNHLTPTSEGGCVSSKCMLPLHSSETTSAHSNLAAPSWPIQEFCPQTREFKEKMHTHSPKYVRDAITHSRGETSVLKRKARENLHILSWHSAALSKTFLDSCYILTPVHEQTK